MVSISLCMIVRNEEKSLGRCLSSVEGIADEMIIVDTGSTDRTKEIAESMGASIFDFAWIDDFGAARNYSFSKATQEYILWLDADDFIAEKDRELFKKLKAALTPDIMTVPMSYNLSFDSEGNVTSSLKRNRLVRRDCNFQWVGPVHEYLEVGGKALQCDVCITHQKDKGYTDRNLRIYRKRDQAGEEFSPRDLYYYGNELRDHGLHAEACNFYEKFLNTGQGWIEDNFQACLKLAECLEKQGKSESAFLALCRTLQYDIPRAEFCCRLGAHFFNQTQYNQSIYWYDLATQLPAHETMGMKNEADSTWVPHLQLCLCYDRLGDFSKANHHNELALRYHPNHPSMLHNKAYFKELLGADYVGIKPKTPVKGKR